MSLNSSAILVGGTIGAVTGGTSKTFVIDGQKVNNGVHLVESSPASFLLADQIIATTKQSFYNASTNESTKTERKLKLVRPYLLASGKLVFRSITTIIEDHPEVPVADQLLLKTDGAQLAIDSDFATFWSVVTLA